MQENLNLFGPNFENLKDEKNLSAEKKLKTTQEDKLGLETKEDELKLKISIEKNKAEVFCNGWELTFKIPRDKRKKFLLTQSTNFTDSSETRPNDYFLKTLEKNIRIELGWSKAVKPEEEKFSPKFKKSLIRDAKKLQIEDDARGDSVYGN